MATQLLDVHDDRATARAHEVIMASRSVDRPWYEGSSLAETVIDWRHVDQAEPKEIYVAGDGEIVGVAILRLPMEDNTSMVWFDIQVDPAHRRHGHGSALMERIVERAAAEGRTSLVTDCIVPQDSAGHPYRRFVERHQFTLSNTEVIRHLDLPTPDGLLDRLEAENQPSRQSGYRLEAYVGGVPERLRESLCTVMNQLAVDAPTGDIEFEEESFNPTRYQEYMDLEREMKRVRLSTVALDDATGEVVAYTDLIVPSGASSTVWQWGTFVHRQHRGHRLGMAVKIENLRRLQADHPERKRVVTGNDGTNDYMVSINEQLGFRIVELCPAYQRKL